MKKVGQITGITTPVRNTKFGARTVTNIAVGGEEFQLGFGKFEVKVGDTVEFDYTDGKYGKDIAKGSLITTPSNLTAPLPFTTYPTPPSINVPAVKTNYVPKNASERTFPIAALSPERAIIRQNALTQARELVVGVISLKSDVSDWDGRKEQLDVLVGEIIRQARKFEAYSAGDLDVAEVKSEMEKA